MLSVKLEFYRIGLGCATGCSRTHRLRLVGAHLLRLRSMNLRTTLGLIRSLTDSLDLGGSLKLRVGPLQRVNRQGLLELIHGSSGLLESSLGEKLLFLGGINVVCFRSIWIICPVGCIVDSTMIALLSRATAILRVMVGFRVGDHMLFGRVLRLFPVWNSYYGGIEVLGFVGPFRF